MEVGVIGFRRVVEERYVKVLETLLEFFVYVVLFIWNISECWNVQVGLDQDGFYFKSNGELLKDLGRVYDSSLVFSKNYFCFNMKNDLVGVRRNVNLRSIWEERLIIFGN